MDKMTKLKNTVDELRQQLERCSTSYKDAESESRKMYNAFTQVLLDEAQDIVRLVKDQQFRGKINRE